MGSEGGRGGGRGKGSARLQELELEWKLRRERVDAVNHRFWVGLLLPFPLEYWPLSRNAQEITKRKEGESMIAPQLPPCKARLSP